MPENRYSPYHRENMQLLLGVSLPAEWRTRAHSACVHMRIRTRRTLRASIRALPVYFTHARARCTLCGVTRCTSRPVPGSRSLRFLLSASSFWSRDSALLEQRKPRQGRQEPQEEPQRVVSSSSQGGRLTSAPSCSRLKQLRRCIT